MRLIVDMNLSPRWSDLLTAAGIEAAHWSSLGSASATDVDIMTYARAHDWVVLTHDLDFGTILSATQGRKPSVVQIRAETVSPDAIGTLVVAALKQMAQELDDGVLLTIEPNRMRMRLLPLQT